MKHTWEWYRGIISSHLWIVAQVTHSVYGATTAFEAAFGTSVDVEVWTCAMPYHLQAPRPGCACSMWECPPSLAEFDLWFFHIHPSSHELLGYPISLVWHGKGHKSPDWSRWGCSDDLWVGLKLLYAAHHLCLPVEAAGNGGACP